MTKPIIFLFLLLIVLGWLTYNMRSKKGVSGFFLALFVTLFFLLLSEFLYRSFFKPAQIRSTVNGYFRYDSLMGYKFKDTGRLTATEYFINGDTIYNTIYTILDDTIHDDFNYPFRKGYKSVRQGTETVFLGCSVTFGECLPDEETLPYQYGKIAGTSTVNRACNGFGIHQVYQTFQMKYSKQDNHNRVFVYSFLPDHLVRANCIYTWNMAGPYFVRSGDSLIFKGPAFHFKKIKGLSLAYYASFLGAFTFIKDNVEKIALAKSIKELTSTDIAACYLMLKKMARTIHETGGRFIILNWDNGHHLYRNVQALNQDSINKRLVQETADWNAKVLNVSAVLDFADPTYKVTNDGHPTAIANKIVAEYLFKNIE